MPTPSLDSESAANATPCDQSGLLQPRRLKRVNLLASTDTCFTACRHALAINYHFVGAGPWHYFIISCLAAPALAALPCLLTPYVSWITKPVYSDTFNTALYDPRSCRTLCVHRCPMTHNLCIIFISISYITLDATPTTTTTTILALVWRHVPRSTNCSKVCSIMTSQYNID